MSIQSLGEQVLIPYLSYTGPLKKALTTSHGQGIVKPYLAASVFIGGDEEDDEDDDVDVFEGKQAGNGISRSLCNIFTQSPLIASAGDFILELELEFEFAFDLLLSLFLIFEEEDDDGNGSSPQSYRSH